MRKHNQIHTSGAPHYKAHFRFLSKLKDFKCPLWSEKYGLLKCVIEPSVIFKHQKKKT